MAMYRLILFEPGRSSQQKRLTKVLGNYAV
jgi:hypothetical protein